MPLFLTGVLGKVELERGFNFMLKIHHDSSVHLTGNVLCATRSADDDHMRMVTFVLMIEPESRRIYSLEAR
jgi:hypothetical protein